jgi:hypothetical protein
VSCLWFFLLVVLVEVALRDMFLGIGVKDRRGFGVVFVGNCCSMTLNR